MARYGIFQQFGLGEGQRAVGS